ncbi:Sialic acid-binding Ig-like lectin 15, partial [Tinamus guttatus]
WSVQVPSDVTGEFGKTAVLPCTFTHPYKTIDRTLTAIWRIREPYNGTVVFKCVTQGAGELCKTAVSYKNKYKLLGNPRHKDLTIRIDNLTWSDSERYFCRVELSGDIHDKYESTQENSNAVSEGVLAGVESARRHTWPQGQAQTLIKRAGILYLYILLTSGSHQVTKELQHLAQDGKYTCTAVNSHGRAEGAVYFYKFKAANSDLLLILIFVPLGIKVLVLLALV